MELYVIRHGESVANAGHCFAGWSQVPLTDKGKEQARRTGKRLEGFEFDRIFSSDQCRAKQTAELVFPGRDYTEDRRIRELSVGAMLECRQRDDCIAEYGDSIRDAMRTHDFALFGGEDVPAHLKRVSEFMEDLKKYSTDSRIAVVCHAGTIFCMLCYVLGVEMDYRSVITENACVSVFELEDGMWKLCKWNETGDLRKETNSLTLQNV